MWRAVCGPTGLHRGSLTIRKETYLGKELELLGSLSLSRVQKASKQTPLTLIRSSAGIQPSIARPRATDASHVGSQHSSLAPPHGSDCIGRSASSAGPITPMSKVSLLSVDDARWRTFALAYATSPMQHPTWLDALIRAYRLRVQVVALTDSEGTILAALPMIRSKLPWRRRWTSLPFTDTLEPVAVDGTRRDELLVAAAERAAAEPIVIRSHVSVAGWYSRQVGTVQVIDLSCGTEGVLRSAKPHHRRSVQRAQRAAPALSARPITSRSEFLGACLSLMARSRRRLGAPTQPRRYWAQVWELHERDEAVTIGVYLGAKMVATGIFVVGKSHAVYKYGASDLATRHLRTNFMMFATAFDHIADRGVHSMDFGITDLDNSSLRAFKARWGGDELPAYYSATDVRLLPQSLEPRRLLAMTIQHTPVLLGRAIGSLAYPFVA